MADEAHELAGKCVLLRILGVLRGSIACARTPVGFSVGPQTLALHRRRGMAHVIESLGLAYIMEGPCVYYPMLCMSVAALAPARGCTVMVLNHF